MKLMLNVRFNNEFHVCVSHSCEAHVSEYIQLLADFENGILKKSLLLVNLFYKLKINSCVKFLISI